MNENNSEQQPIKFSPKIGDRIKLIKSEKETDRFYLEPSRGSLVFTKNTGELFIDDYDPIDGKLKHIPVKANGLTNSEIIIRPEDGKELLQIQSLSFSEVANKMDKISIPQGEEAKVIGSIPVINENGTLSSSGKNIDDVGSGNNNVVYTEIILYKDLWKPETKTQAVGIPNVTENSTVIVAPKNPKTGIKNGVHCFKQTNTSLEFIYTSRRPPEENINLIILIYGNQANELVDEKKFKENITLLASDWKLYEDAGIKGYYQNCDGGTKLREDSIVTVSPVNPIETSQYNVYAKTIRADGDITFHCDYKPSNNLEYTLFIENYI